MSKKSEKQMAKMVDPVQPHCDEKIIAAITCSHAGSMRSLLVSKLMGQGGGGGRTSDLPNPVFLAVSDKTIYAFKYVPRGFSFKFKKEVARWKRDDVKVEYELSGGMATFVISTNAVENYSLEFPIVMGGRELAVMFFDALEAKEFS
jgi:hypothetical protein